MSTSPPPPLNYDLLCPVCLDLLHSPVKTRPCGHTFCDPCLRRVAKMHSGRKTSRPTIPCPQCRTAITYCDTDEGQFV